ncbi:unnamed protein product [Nippostrongylus brasiliensis]|uniref:SERPIN domain-containing protein n=1 Tax=Nippostrongylus brasiliensis TaxID=27835 RepID=A0A0N4YTW1_NIPBR|nr:unnamed protein product [Nippostrongylus brasiliensis]
MTSSVKFQDSTPETCSRMQRLATAFGISDISSYVRKNCTVLLVFAPGFTCEQITYFVDSCHKKSFL